MKSLLRKLFIDNWQRKLLAFTLALITWIFVNNSLVFTKTLTDVPVKIANLPEGKTIKGIKTDNFLGNTIILILTGNKKTIEKITSKDLYVLIDVKDSDDGFTTIITKDNLVALNPNLKIKKAIKAVKPVEISIELTTLITEKIPVFLEDPNGEAPNGYDFLNIWPYQLYITISGPEEIVKKLKTKGIDLTLDLNSITEEELNTITSETKNGKKNIVSYYIPTSWKKVYIPEISSSLIEIDDPLAKLIRIDFIKQVFLPFDFPIPISLFFPINTSETLNPSTISVEEKEYIKKINGIDVLDMPLFVDGINEQYLNIIKDRIQIQILVENNNKLKWTVELVDSYSLENTYVNANFNNQYNLPTGNYRSEAEIKLKKHLLQFRFRRLFKKFKLCTSKDNQLDLDITLKDGKISVVPKK
ncbi:MAG: hypothetical protein JXA94_00810 [Parachlamydiales bacterium]|nr:hypothetical protein [Parachlamydiales bacterium]